MFVIGATFHSLEPDVGTSEKTVTVPLTSSHYYKVVTGSGETDIFPADVNGEIPVKLNVHSQGGDAVECSLSGGTLTIKANYPWIGFAQVVEYANVLEEDTDVRSFVTNWYEIKPNIEDIQSTLHSVLESVQDLQTTNGTILSGVQDLQTTNGSILSVLEEFKNLYQSANP